jgi:hypothetical protein
MPTRRRDMVSRATCIAFRRLATNLTVRAISEAWQSHNFAPVPEDELRYTDTSVRRTTFESYASAVDWSDRNHVTRALRVFEDIIRTGKREEWSGRWLDDWAITGEMPAINVPLMPKSGPWRSVVREAPTVTPRAGRPQSRRFTSLSWRRRWLPLSQRW